MPPELPRLPLKATGLPQTVVVAKELLAGEMAGETQALVGWIPRARTVWMGLTRWRGPTQVSDSGWMC